jgi:hypothetical protein
VNKYYFLSREEFDNGQVERLGIKSECMSKPLALYNNVDDQGERGNVVLLIYPRNRDYGGLNRDKI